MITMTTNDETPVKFLSGSGEELTIIMNGDEYILEYLDAEDVVQTWRLRDGFVRRLSLKGRAGANNVVPFKRSK